MSAVQPRRIVPPVYFFLALIAIVGLHKYFPVAQMLEPPISFAGAGLIALGIAIAAWAARAFGKAGTPVVPFHQSTSLVTGGLYRHTRNPMYLGMVFVLVGAAILFGSVSAWAPIPLFVWIIHSQFIRPEELFLEGIFGDEFMAYKKNVRRWI